MLNYRAARGGLQVVLATGLLMACATLMMGAFASLAKADHVQQRRWEPMSGTAIAITGPIQFNNGQLWMSGKPRFNYQRVSSKKEDATSFALTPIAGVDPTLRGGNTLCGQQTKPVRIDAQVADNNADKTLLIQVYGVPSNEAAQPPTLCASYSYLWEQDGP